MMKTVSVCIVLVTLFAVVNSNPQGGTGAGGVMVLPNSAIPHSGFVGGFDSLSAGFENAFIAFGSAFDALFSGLGGLGGNSVSGVLGSGAINSAFLNYNNRPAASG